MSSSPLQIVTPLGATVEAFRLFVAKQAAPRLLVCYFGPQQTASVDAAIRAVDTAIAAHLVDATSSQSQDGAKPLVDAAFWDIAPFPAAQKMLGIAPLDPNGAVGDDARACDAALIIMVKGEVVDTFVGSQAITESADDMAKRVRRHLTPGATSVVDKTSNANSSGALQVDVAKMLAMGKNLMAKSQALYAEKFFLKALGVLDAVAEDATLHEAVARDVNFLLSLAECLAWVVMSQLVQGKHIEKSEAAERLEAEHGLLAPLRPYPTNQDVQRALSLRTVFRYSPYPWNADTCSIKQLSAQLAAAPTDHKSRSLLVITLFLTNDLERCLTEALKLQVLGQDFGAIALDAVTQFLGPDHELVQRLGWKGAQ